MFGFGKSTPPLLKEVTEYLRYKPEAQVVVAVVAGYLPHGGSEVFWFHPDGDAFDCHAAHTSYRGGVTVRHCREPMSTILGALSEANFFELRDAKREVIDGLVYRIAVANRTQSHYIEGNGISSSSDQIQTKLFYTLTAHFPCRR